MKKVSYNTLSYNFYKLLQGLFQVDDLQSISADADLFTREKDQSTEYHKKYYELARTKEFQDLYTNFLQEVVQPLYRDTIIYQKIPNFRICFPNNVAVGEFHRDRDYRDLDWAVDVKEDNFYLPITDAFDTNTIRVETEEGKEDYYPIEGTFGDLVQWDGANLKHGNKQNKTSQTRISLDFRVIQKKNYRASDHGSINTQTKFKLGGYYEELKYKLSNLAHKDNKFDVDSIVERLWINDGSIKDFQLKEVVGKKILSDEEFQKKIDASWSFLKSRANAAGKELYNGKSFQLEDLNIEDKVISISKSVDYKTVVSTRSNQELFKNHTWSPVPNAFVVVNVLIAADNKIVLGKRDFYGDWPNQTYETPGAFSNYGDLEANSLIKITQRKIYEDYDFDGKTISFDTMPFAIYRFPRILETIFLCITRIHVNADKLHARKYSDVMIVDNSYEGLESIINMPVDMFHPPSRTVLQFFYQNYDKASKIISSL